MNGPSLMGRCNDDEPTANTEMQLGKVVGMKDPTVQIYDANWMEFFRTQRDRKQ